MIKYKAICFDYTGVISGRPSKYFDEEIIKIIGVSEEQYRKSYFKFNELFNKHSVGIEELWLLVLKDLGKIDKYDDVIKFLSNQKPPELNKDILNIVDKIKANGYKVGLLSNNSKKVAEKMRASGIASHFDSFMISAEIGHMKPSVEAFEILCKDLGVSMSEMVFIDDTEKSLSMACQIGFYPILYRDNVTLLESLSKIGIII